MARVCISIIRVTSCCGRTRPAREQTSRPWLMSSHFTTRLSECWQPGLHLTGSTLTHTHARENIAVIQTKRSAECVCLDALLSNTPSRHEFLSHYSETKGTWIRYKTQDVGVNIKHALKIKLQYRAIGMFAIRTAHKLNLWAVKICSWGG